MKKSFFILLIAPVLVFSLSLPASAEGRENYSDVPKVSVPGLFSFWVEWIKDKGDKYDYRLHLDNDSPNKDLIVRANHIECSRGEKGGSTKNRYIDRHRKHGILSNLSIYLGMGQKIDFNSFCLFDEKTKGPYKIVIKRVYDNPSQDGVTLGEVVASDLVWYSPK